MFKFNERYTLTNHICELSPLNKSHQKELLAAADNESIWVHFEEYGRGAQNFQQYVSRALQLRDQEKQYPFVIKDLRSEKYVGMTRIYDVNNMYKTLKIGHTWLGVRFQGSGLNKHAKYLLFSFLFDDLKMQRIGFGASSKNHRSINALKSIGCTQEGILRSLIAKPKSDERVDIVLMSVLFNEWNNHIRHTLKEKL